MKKYETVIGNNVLAPLWQAAITGVWRTMVVFLTLIMLRQITDIALQYYNLTWLEFFYSLGIPLMVLASLLIGSYVGERSWRTYSEMAMNELHKIEEATGKDINGDGHVGAVVKMYLSHENGGKIITVSASPYQLGTWGAGVLKYAPGEEDLTYRRWRGVFSETKYRDFLISLTDEVVVLGENTQSAKLAPRGRKHLRNHLG